MKTTALLITITITLLLCSVAQADEQSAKWWAQERKCLADCPKLPRFSGSETTEQFNERIRKTDEFNFCQRSCTHEYLNKVNPQKAPFDDGAKGYFQRNE